MDDLHSSYTTSSSSSSFSFEEEEAVVEVLPGFRFHPTEEELLNFYLRNMLLGQLNLHSHIIGFLNIYHHDPWELPGLAKIGEREWYFFVPRDGKNGSSSSSSAGGGGRRNRTTKNGFWKATGSERKIMSLTNPKKMIGLKKTLVFYTGRAPRGCKTTWVMNEYRLPDHHHRGRGQYSSVSTHNQPLGAPPKVEVVVCKIYTKATSLKVLEQRAAIIQDLEPEEEEEEEEETNPSEVVLAGVSICNQQTAAAASINMMMRSSNTTSSADPPNYLCLKREFDQHLLQEELSHSISNRNYSCLLTNHDDHAPSCKQPNLPQIEDVVPVKDSKMWRHLEMKMEDYWSTDHDEDPFWTQLHEESPWEQLLDNNLLSPWHLNYH